MVNNKKSGSDSAMLLALINNDPSEAEKFINKLPLSKQVETVLAIDWAKRYDLMLLSSNPSQLIQAMPEEEIYWTIKERGVDDSLPVISRTSHDQFQYMLDIDCWNRDSLDKAPLASWLKILARCNEAKVVQWFNNTDDEFLVTTFKKFLKIVKIEQESDISEEYEDMPLYTLDNVNYFNFFNEDDRIFIIPLLNVLHEDNNRRFYALIDAIYWDFDVEQEHEAFRWRQSRIAEKGFPDLDEALTVYQVLSDYDINEIKSCISPQGNSLIKNNHNAGILNYTMTQNNPDLFIVDVFKALPDTEKTENLQKYIVNISNKIIVADCLEIRQIKDAKQALRKVQGYINIALEFLSGCKIDTAVWYLLKTHPQMLFSFGYTLIIKLKRRMLKISKNLNIQDMKQFSGFLIHPWSEAIDGLNRKRPMFSRSIESSGGEDYREFETLADMKNTENIVNTVAAAADILSGFFGISVPAICSGHEDVLSCSSGSNITAVSVFLTIFANHILYEKNDPEPLAIDELKFFMSEIFEKRKNKTGYILKKNLFDDCIQWIFNEFDTGKTDRRWIKNFIMQCFKTFEDECSGLVDINEIDARFITTIMLKKTS